MMPGRLRRARGRGIDKLDPATWTLRRWPVLVALGLMALLMVSLLGIDMVVARRVSRETEDILQNALQSIVLLHDMRIHTNRLAAPALGRRESDQVAALLTAETRHYEPLATYPGELDEWRRLQGLLDQLRAGLPGSPGWRAGHVEAIEKSLDRLVSINLEGMHTSAASIHRADRQALLSDALAAGAALILTVAIGAWLIRALGRQRRMVEERVHFLDQKNSELEAFAGRAAHDLRSPMNPIRGYADLILETNDLPEGVASMAQRIRRAVDRMAHVVDDMLALSISGRPLPGQSATSVVVARTLEEMGAELNEVHVTTNLLGGRVACSEGVLSQILRNLIGNAIKFRAPGRPLRISIETRDAGPMVELAVEDNGVGMDAESARHAFEPFYRGQMDRELPGHGLGLAIVERTTRALGGSCALTSTLDRSTKIVLRLPRP